MLYVEECLLRISETVNILNINADRQTLALNPVIAANAHNVRIIIPHLMMRVVCERLRNDSKMLVISIIMPVCKPETARMCIAPLVWNDVMVSGSRSAL